MKSVAKVIRVAESTVRVDSRFLDEVAKGEPIIECTAGYFIKRKGEAAWEYKTFSIEKSPWIETTKMEAK